MKGFLIIRESLFCFLPWSKKIKRMETGFGIKSWAEDDRPYEKLLGKGARALSDSELLAIFIKSGTKKLTAVDAAKQLLAPVENNIDILGKLSVQQIVNKKIPGIGKVKALNIVAALELGKRRRDNVPQELSRITSSKSAFDILIQELENVYTEEFWILLLDRSNKVIKKINVSKGGISGTVADPRVIFRLAVEHHACGIILCHNHPSGNLSPSNEDKVLTKKFIEAGSVLDIKVFDHIIIAGNSYLSFADEGLL